MWGPQHREESNYLRVHMAHLRRKLDPCPAPYLITEPGMGYRFVTHASPTPYAYAGFRDFAWNRRPLRATQHGDAPPYREIAVTRAADLPVACPYGLARR